MQALSGLRPFLAPLVLGSVLLGAVAAASAYLVSIWVITAYRRRVARTAHEAQAELELVVPGVFSAGPAQGVGAGSGPGGEPARRRELPDPAAGAVDSAADRP